MQKPNTELIKKVETLEAKLAEKTKGNITSDTPKPKYALYQNKNPYKPGTVDFSAEGFNY